MIVSQYIKMIKKSKTRIFFNKRLSKHMMVYIKEKQLHFLKNVLRVKLNDQITIFDNITGEWFSKIMSINKDNIVLQILKKNRDIAIEPDIWLVFSPIKLQRLNITLQKATELGVSKLIPCTTNYTNNNFLNYRNLNLNIIEAAEQCERLTLPVLEKQITLDEYLLHHPNDRALIFCNENINSNEIIFSRILKIKDRFTKWALLIGPEGGFSEKEITEIEKLSNCFSVSLGSRILRSDTATTSALFCLQSIIESS
jgi:16S rRNA (uracil1498-N3)-methyltransferase